MPGSTVAGNFGSTGDNYDTTAGGKHHRCWGRRFFYDGSYYVLGAK